MMQTFTDKLGMSWNARPPTKAGGFWNGSLQMPAYGSQPGQDVISAKTLDALKSEANAYADDYLASGGKPPARGSLDVTAPAPKPSPQPGGSGIGGGLLLLLALLFLERKRR